jgi:hypothetical protein
LTTRDGSASIRAFNRDGKRIYKLGDRDEGRNPCDDGFLP